jgi:kynureninase
MRHEWEGAVGAGAWQISTPPILAAAPLFGSLQIFAEAGMDAIRAKSLAQTGYLINLLEATGLTGPEFGYQIGTPRQPEQRGGHVAVEHEAGPQIAHALKARGVVPDFRPPNVIRLAPVPLYTSYHDLWRVIQELRDIVTTGAYRGFAGARDLVA